MNTGIENLAWGLAEKGFNVHILSGGTKPQKHGYKLPKNVIYHFIGTKANNPFVFINKFEELVIKENIKIVIGWIFYLACLYSSGNKLLYIANQGQMAPKSIIRLVVSKFFSKQFGMTDALKIFVSLKFNSKKIHHITSISQSVQSSCISTYNLNKFKCSVIPRGIDPNKFYFNSTTHYSKSKFDLLYAGNILPGKGINELIDSLDHLNSPVKITFCGKGDDEYIESIKTKAKLMPDNHELKFVGTQLQDSLIDYYHKSDAFIFPSHSEGLGKVLIESMSCGCPVICSDISTFKEIVTNEYNGLMVPIKSPIELSKAIKKYMDNPSLREKCSINARKTVEEKFSKEKEINSWMELIKETVFE